MGDTDKVYNYQGPKSEVIENFMSENQSTVHMFYATVKKYGERPAQKFKLNGEYQVLTYRDFADRVEAFAHGFMALGLKKGDCMSIMAGTSPFWDWADYGGRAAGCIVGTIYPTSSNEEIVTIANDSDVQCLCVGNEELLEKILGVKSKIPTLKSIIVLDPAYAGSTDGVLSAEKLNEIGREYRSKNPAEYESRWTSLRHEDPASILYTSGTTGNLKGCMLTHKNILAATLAVLQTAIWGGHPFCCEDVAFSVLPLSHNWNRFDNHSSCIAYGGLIGYAESPKTLIQNFQEIKPTFLMMVARLWDRVFEGVKALITSTPEGKETFEWAMEVGRRVFEQREDENGVVDLTADPTANIDVALKEDFLKADAEVFSIFRNVFGGRIKFAYSGGSLLPADLQRNYWSMNFPLLDGWGLTETTSGICMIQPRCARIGWLSPDFEGPNAEGKLDDDGEILVRGDAVIKEYFKKPQDTAASFTPDGWFRTGDIGEMEHGYLRIIDRKKSIIVLDTGKNVSPAHVELKFANCPIIDQLVVLGDDRKYITALIVPAYDVIITMFKNKGIVFDESKLVYATLNGINTCIEVGDDLVAHPELVEMIDREVRKANSELSDFEAIKRYHILPRKLTEERGEITPTLKVKNRVVRKNYAVEIDNLYK